MVGSPIFSIITAFYVRTTACTSISLNITIDVINIVHPLQCSVLWGAVIHATATWYALPIQTPFADQAVFVVFQGIVLQWGLGAWSMWAFEDPRFPSRSMHCKDMINVINFTCQWVNLIHMANRKPSKVPSINDYTTDYLYTHTKNNSQSVFIAPTKL